ncbi:NrdH-redoxin [Actinophytocola sp. S1-96]|uniref:NrdH-redoxin n=1 Tax=Actinophytocola gossypii TaxID=2812003 RepID=A0ABT2JBM0_9PSEU|nr:NrdH-redoxin [Actinophytocola gossypii]
MTGTGRVQLYGADWCDDTRGAITWMNRHHVPFTGHDTTDDEVRAAAVELAGGRTDIPVVVTPDGTVLVEPTVAELAGALAGLRPRRTARSRCR